MRIAQVAPLYESVPPRLYGGTERIVSYLTEELVALGHDVTLLASGDSATSARLVPCWPRALRLGAASHSPSAAHVLMFEELARRAPAFDLLHFHTDFLHFPVARRLGVPWMTTLHGRLDLPHLVPIFREFREARVISITDSQRAPLPWLAWAGTVYHGLPAGLLRPTGARPAYLAFLGRISKEKRPDLAVRIAAEAGLPLRIAAKVDPSDRHYFETAVRPLLGRPGVEFLGEIGERDKPGFLGGAAAVLCPIDWPEPFGLVMIEAMACGTPVIAFRQGSVPEIVEDGLTGFIVDDVEQAARAVPWAVRLDRRRIRRRFEERFTARRMAEDYEAIYRRIAGHGGALERPGRRIPEVAR